MSELLLDAAGRQRSPATPPHFHAGRPPRNRGIRYPADPSTVEEIVTVMRGAGDDVYGLRLRGLIVVLNAMGVPQLVRSRPQLAPAQRSARRGAWSASLLRLPLQSSMGYSFSVRLEERAALPALPRRPVRARGRPDRSDPRPVGRRPPAAPRQPAGHRSPARA